MRKAAGGRFTERFTVLNPVGLKIAFFSFRTYLKTMHYQIRYSIHWWMSSITLSFSGSLRISWYRPL